MHRNFQTKIGENKKILLVAPPSDTYRTPEESLGIEYLAAAARKNFYEVVVFDAWIDGLNVENVVQEAVDKNYFCVGLSPSMDSIKNTTKIITALKNKNFSGHVIVGGVYASFHAEKLVKDFGKDFDGVITGESDYSFLDFLSHGKINKVEGAVYLKKNKVAKNSRDINKTVSLDLLPNPVRDYLKKLKKLKLPIQIMGSRGCYGNCSFCSIACFQKFSSDKRWRGRSPISIVQEMKFLSKCGVNMVKFVDDNFFNFNHTQKRELEIASLLIKQKNKINFRISLRANDVNEATIKKLKQAGLFAVSLGVESFVQRKLNCFRKGTTVQQNVRALKILKKYNIYVQMGFIMFDPYISLDEIKQELIFLKKFNWAITKGVSSSLFAAVGTDITREIIQNCNVISTDESNYYYKLLDDKAELFKSYLLKWNKVSNQICEMVIDPLSSPKNIEKKYRKKFHNLCIKTKNLDIKIAKIILLGIEKNNFDDQSIKSIIDKHFSILQTINKQTEKLYKICGLKLLPKSNHRLSL